MDCENTPTNMYIIYFKNDQTTGVNDDLVSVLKNYLKYIKLKTEEQKSMQNNKKFYSMTMRLNRRKF